MKYLLRESERGQVSLPSPSSSSAQTQGDNSLWDSGRNHLVVLLEANASGPRKLIRGQELLAQL